MRSGDGVCQVSVETPPCSTGGRTVKLDLFLIKLGYCRFFLHLWF